MWSREESGRLAELSFASAAPWRGKGRCAGAGRVAGEDTVVAPYQHRSNTVVPRLFQACSLHVPCMFLAFLRLSPPLSRPVPGPDTRRLAGRRPPGLLSAAHHRCDLSRRAAWRPEVSKHTIQHVEALSSRNLTNFKPATGTGAAAGQFSLQKSAAGFHG